MAEQQDKAEREIGKFAGTYSPDVEIDADGTLRWARDVEKGETIMIPGHMLAMVRR